MAAARAGGLRDLTLTGRSSLVRSGLNAAAVHRLFVGIDLGYGADLAVLGLALLMILPESELTAGLCHRRRSVG